MQIREKYLKRIRPYYHSDLIKALTGIRRSGKSTILSQIMDEIGAQTPSKQIIFYDFEDYDNAHYLHDPAAFYSEVKRRVAALNGKRGFVFIDEVQYLDDYIPVIASIRSSLWCSVFVTGSTSTLISSDFEAKLTGRYTEFTILPFSYDEASEFTGRDDDSFLAQYIEWGGFPVRFQEGINPRVAIGDILGSIISRDITSRHKELNTWALQDFASYILAYSGNIVSAGNLATYISSRGEKTNTSTCYKYLSAMKEAYLISTPDRFDIKGKAMLKTRRKAYAMDPALVTLQRGSTAAIKQGAVIETMIYNELVSRGYEVTTGKTYKGEIDFVISNGTERCYLQSAYLLGSDDVIKREFGAYSTIKDNWPKYVVSMDTLDFSRDGIIHMNLRDFLSGRKQLAVRP